MVFLKRQIIKDFSYVSAYTNEKHIIFDCPAPLYGKNHRFPSFSSHKKPIQFLVPDIKQADEIFISNPESFGSLFLQGDIKIYCTKPVYEQLLIVFDEYKTISLTYDEEDIPTGCRLVKLDDLNINSFISNTIFLKFNQRIPVGSQTIIPLPAGTGIGWCNFKMIFPNEQSLIYLTSYSFKNRFSIEAQRIESTYLLINRKNVNHINEIDQFSNFLKGRKIKDMPINNTKRDNSIGSIPGLFDRDLKKDDFQHKRLKNLENVTIYKDLKLERSEFESLYNPSSNNTFPGLGFDHNQSELTSESLFLYNPDQSISSLIDPNASNSSFPANSNPSFLSKSNPESLEIPKDSNILSKAENPNLFLSSKSNRTILLPSRMESVFIELIFHVLSVVEYTNIPIYVISPIFHKLELLLNIQSEWLNNMYCTITEPFPIKKYPNFHIADNFNIEFSETNKIVFCSQFEFSLFENTKLFDNQQTVFINSDFEIQEDNFYKFEIKIEATNEEIISSYDGKLVDEGFIPSESNNFILHVNDNLNVFDDKILISGIINYSDFNNQNRAKLILKDKIPVLKELMEREDFILNEDWFIFSKYKIKYRKLNEEQFEYSYL